MNDQNRFEHEVTRQLFEIEEMNMELSALSGNWDEIAEDPAWDVFANIRKVCMAVGREEREYLAWLDSHAPLEIDYVE